MFYRVELIHLSALCLVCAVNLINHIYFEAYRRHIGLFSDINWHFWRGFTQLNSVILVSKSNFTALFKFINFGR